MTTTRRGFLGAAPMAAAASLARPVAGNAQTTPPEPCVLRSEA